MQHLTLHVFALLNLHPTQSSVNFEAPPLSEVFHCPCDNGYRKQGVLNCIYSGRMSHDIITLIHWIKIDESEEDGDFYFFGLYILL